MGSNEIVYAEPWINFPSNVRKNFCRNSLKNVQVEFRQICEILFHFSSNRLLHYSLSGTNLPGPRIEYNTTTQDGDPQHGASAQLPQSAYFALHLPYTTFGLGRTPNFVDSLTVGLSNHSRTWTQLIPNSQMIVVPWPIDETDKWKAQLFVTPSKLILMSVVALGGICLVILLLILILYAKEKREDRIQRSLEAHRFHFDAM